ncbi:MAG: hypothetical protein KatS3mg014_0848 [Actinomycetota bacterium]|nr:MAG: hypothetical protein KatS3mg014_0848 [Actinomycetota bacterium]
MGVEDPEDPSAELLRLHLLGGALATSSTTRRAWGPGLHHLIDPATALPAATGVLQATAWAPECAEAEVAAKDALLRGPGSLQDVPGVLVLSRRAGPHQPRARDGGRVTTWNVLRAAGIGAYVMLFLSVCWGLVSTTTPFGKLVSKPTATLAHQFMSTSGLALLGVHLGGLLLDRYEPFALRQLFVPMAATYRPVPVALGIVAMYLLVVVVVTSWLRRTIGTAWWRRTHLLAVPTFAPLPGAWAPRRHRRPTSGDVVDVRGDRAPRGVPRPRPGLHRRPATRAPSPSPPTKGAPPSRARAAADDGRPRSHELPPTVPGTPAVSSGPPPGPLRWLRERVPPPISSPTWSSRTAPRCGSAPLDPTTRCGWRTT